MAKFIKVTKAHGGEKVRINCDKILAYQADLQGRGYIEVDKSKGFTVKETPDEIDKLIAETEEEDISYPEIDENMTFDEENKVVAEIKPWTSEPACAEPDTGIEAPSNIVQSTSVDYKDIFSKDAGKSIDKDANSDQT